MIGDTVLKNLTLEMIGILKKNKKLRRNMIIVSTVIIIITFILYVLRDKLFSLEVQNQYDILLILPFSFIYFLLISLYAEIPNENIVQNFFDKELDEVKKKKEEIEERIQENKNDTNNILDIISLNLNQINGYYIINQKQAKTTYSFSLFCIFTGLITFLVGIWLFYFGSNPRLDLAFITGSVGAIIEFIGGLNFYMYKKNTEQIKYFYDTLVDLQNTMLAVKLCDTIEENNKRNENKEKIIESLIRK